jgi:hypothetical protein
MQITALYENVKVQRGNFGRPRLLEVLVDEEKHVRELYQSIGEFVIAF